MRRLYFVTFGGIGGERADAPPRRRAIWLLAHAKTSDELVTWRLRGAMEGILQRALSGGLIADTGLLVDRIRAIVKDDLRRSRAGEWIRPGGHIVALVHDVEGLARPDDYDTLVIESAASAMRKLTHKLRIWVSSGHAEVIPGPHGGEVSWRGATLRAPPDVVLRQGMREHLITLTLQDEPDHERAWFTLWVASLRAPARPINTWRSTSIALGTIWPPGHPGAARTPEYTIEDAQEEALGHVAAQCAQDLALIERMMERGGAREEGAWRRTQERMECLSCPFRSICEEEGPP